MRLMNVTFTEDENRKDGKIYFLTKSGELKEIGRINQDAVNLSTDLSVDGTLQARFSDNYAAFGGGFIHDGSPNDLGVMIKLPYTIGSEHMVMFTVNVYGAYSTYKILFSGYMYDSADSGYNWHAPKAELISGDNQRALRVAMGRDTDGMMYVWIAGLQYIGISVTDITGTYRSGDWSRGWAFVRTNSTPNLRLDTILRRTGYVRARLAKPPSTTTGTWMSFKDLTYDACSGLIRINPDNNRQILIDGSIREAVVHISIQSTGTAFNVYPRVQEWGPGNKNISSSNIGYNLNKELTFVNLTGNQGIFDCEIWTSEGALLDFNETLLNEMYWCYLDITAIF